MEDTATRQCRGKILHNSRMPDGLIPDGVLEVKVIIRDNYIAVDRKLVLEGCSTTDISVLEENFKLVDCP